MNILILCVGILQSHAWEAHGFGDLQSRALHADASALHSLSTHMTLVADKETEQTTSARVARPRSLRKVAIVRRGGSRCGYEGKEFGIGRGSLGALR
jgi:hypothetical protein